MRIRRTNNSWFGSGVDQFFLSVFFIDFSTRSLCWRLLEKAIWLLHDWKAKVGTEKKERKKEKRKVFLDSFQQQQRSPPLPVSEPKRPNEQTQHEWNCTHSLYGGVKVFLNFNSKEREREKTLVFHKTCTCGEITTSNQQTKLTTAQHSI